MKDERGYSLVELLVAAGSGIVVLLALFAMLDLSIKNSAQVTERVDANQRAKPVLQSLMDDLHSACTGPGIAPVLAGSTGSQLSFQMQTGSAVSPTPSKHVVTLANGKLTQQTFTATSGSNPTWVYSNSPATTRQLLTEVTPPSAAQGATFAYYAANAGVISTSPLPTPLSAADALRAVEVKVTLQVAPSSTTTSDPNSSVVLSDAAIFRFSPFSEDPTKVNGPCM